ncbi:MAG: MerR family transcriptional regulator [Chitinophagaceae bacterium]|nr:MerR family transcriptional regulator [Chitinophagaceae bacterium]
MNAFTIKDLENLSGIKAHTIRIWEQRYGFLKPQRTSTNIRFYSSDELKTILNVALLNKYGFKVSHIDKMQPQEIQERILALTDIAAMQERFVNDLLQAMIDLDMDLFEKILANYIIAKGIERTIIQIIFPFLEKIGILWLTGHIIPAQEHLVTNIIRQKIIVAIDKAESPLVADKTALLFLPESEYHELGLLFLNFILKNRGIKTIYLGANVPLKDIDFVFQQKKPDVIFIHLTATSANFNFEKFLQQIHVQFGTTKTVISGFITQQYKKKVPPGIECKKSLQELLAFIPSI